jgi:hypothetical protein
MDNWQIKILILRGMEFEDETFIIAVSTIDLISFMYAAFGKMVTEGSFYSPLIR